MVKRKKVQKDKQRSTKNTRKTKDRVTQTSLKTGGGTRRVNLVTNPVSKYFLIFNERMLIYYRKMIIRQVYRYQRCG